MTRRDRRFTTRGRSGRVPAIALVAFAVVVPVVGLVSRTIGTADVVDVWTRPGVGDAIWFSLWQGLVSALATAAVGIALAGAIARTDFPGRRTVHAIVTVPFVLPTVVVGAAFLALLPSSLDRTATAIVLAHTFFNVSVIVRTLVPVWSRVDPGLVEAARTLGASPIRVVGRVWWPLLRSPVRTSFALVFAMCATSFGVVRVLGGPSLNTVDAEIYRRAVDLGDLAGAGVLAIAQAVVIALLITWSARGEPVRLPTLAVDRVRPRLSRVGRAFVAIVVAGFVAPLAALVIASLRTSDGWSLAGWSHVLGFESSARLDIDAFGALGNSLEFAVVAVVLTVPTAIALVRRDVERPSRIVSMVTSLPVAMSAVLVGLGIVVTYDRSPYDFRGEWWLVPIVHASVALPFVVRIIAPLVAAVPRRVEEAAATLGASPRLIRRRVTLPLLRPAVATAVGSSAAMSLGEFGATSFLTRRDTETLPIVVESLLGRAGGLPRTVGDAVACLLLVVTFAIALTADRSWQR